MVSSLLGNINEEKRLLELIQGHNLQVKKDMTSKVLNQIGILNKVVMDIANGPETLGKLKKVKNLDDSGAVYVSTSDKSRYLKQKKIIYSILEKDSGEKQVFGGNFYIRISTKLFKKPTQRIFPYFKDLADDLKAANMPLITTTYISMMLFSTSLCFMLGILLSLVFGLSYLWSILVLPLMCFFLFYTYPSAKSSEIDKRINYELPFATIHMGAIAGSNIGPVKLFEIIGSSEEYPNVGFELKKVLNQVVVFGYNVSNSLKNVASRTRNTKLAELLGGIATNINSGGELKSYLEKKSESFLVDYKLERKQYIDLATTFLDIYISVLIAAPLILILLLVIMNLIGTGFSGLGINSLVFIGVILIAIMNIIFIVVLNLKQPEL
jgi:flagellar protein FlaJ